MVTSPCFSNPSTSETSVDGVGELCCARMFETKAVDMIVEQVVYETVMFGNQIPLCYFVDILDRFAADRHKLRASATTGAQQGVRWRRNHSISWDGVPGQSCRVS